jgi:DNA-directed RNA polymerase specialized sigma24 family protein
VPTYTPAATHDLERRFATTRWSRVVVAGDSTSPESRAALERLCQEYWPPLFAFALRRCQDPHSAQDLTQSFFAHFIDRGYLRAANRERGRFRTFLLTCFEHFLVHQWEKERAAKRGGNYVLVSWDEQCDGALLPARSAADLSPEKLYDRAWAQVIMQRAFTRLQNEHAKGERNIQFKVLGRFLSAEVAPGEYVDLGEQLGVAPGAVKLAVHRMRRRFRALVREEIRETVANESDVDDEMRYLVEIISA